MGEVIAMTGIQRRGLTVSQSLLLSAVAWCFVLGLSLTVAHDAWQTGLVAGVVAAVISGVAGIVGVVLTAGRPLNAMLLSRVITFFLRALLVGLGILWSLKGQGGLLSSEVRTDRALAFVSSFFPLFFISIAIEHFTSVVRGPAGTVTPLAAGGSR